MKYRRHKEDLLVLAFAPWLLGTTARRATAQAGFEIGPVVGYYATHGSGDASDGPNGPGNFSAPAYGAELTIWSRGRFGVRAQSVVASSNHQGYANPGGFTVQQSGHIVVGSVAAMLALAVDGPSRLWISAGPGVVGYRGEAFASSDSPTETAAVLGMGGSRSIHKLFAVTAGVSTLLYKYCGILGDIGGPPNIEGTSNNGARGTRFRSDFLVHIAITLGQ